MIKKALTVLFVIITIFLTGCASIPLQSEESSQKAKEFNAPSEGKSGLYIYRDSILGSALKKDIWVDGQCIGETAPNTFFYQEVAGDEEHRVSTESEFSPNDLMIKTEEGINYFIRQFIKVGVFVGGAGLELMETEEGMQAVTKLDLAKSGQCSR